MNRTLKYALIALLLLFCLGLLLLFWCVSGRKGLSTGRYLLADNGSHILIDASGGPIVMGDRTSGGQLFSGLEDGDRILVLHDGVAESYPARSGGYWCLRLSHGTRADLPEDTLAQLTQLGWLAS